MVSTKFVGAVFFALATVAASAYALEPVAGRPGADVTPEFQRYFAGRHSVTREQLAPFRVLFVPGFNADYLEHNHAYFVEQRQELERLGLVEGADFEVLRRQNGFHGEKTMANNSQAIEAYLIESPRPVLLISHSKGGIDVLDALVRSPAARAKVRGWFSIQGAFGGTILADVLSRGWTRPFVEGFLRSYGGSIAALEDLRRPLRLRYMQENLPAIEKLVAELPVIGLTTRKNFEDLPLNLQTLVMFFDPNHSLSLSDGMIEMKDTLLPSAPFVMLDGVDHGETTQLGNFNRVRLLHTALSLLLSRYR